MCMRLSEVANHVPIEVRRDGEFESLGLLSHACRTCWWRSTTRLIWKS